MIQAVTFDIHALVYGPTGAAFLNEVLQAEGIGTDQDEVAQALERLPAEVRALRAAIRTEEQENDYNRAMVPALLDALGYRFPTDALLLRLVETVHQYHAWLSMYPETLPVLHQLRSRGTKLGVLANWEPSLHRLLREFELLGFFSAVVPSMEAGMAKPDPLIFRQALRDLDTRSEEALHVGPSMEEDVTGAIGAGVRPVWLNRTGITAGHEVLTIEDLRGLLILVQGAN